MEHAQIQTLHKRVQALEEREVARSKRPAETTSEATPPSHRRSSVASTELLQPEHVLTAPASYPVDSITESQHLPPYDAMVELQSQGGCRLCSTS